MIDYSGKGRNTSVVDQSRGMDTSVSNSVRGIRTSWIWFSPKTSVIDSVHGIGSVREILNLIFPDSEISKFESPS